jgi:hypothetical protein
MRAKTYIRISIAVLVLMISVVLFAYSRKSATPGDGNPDCSNGKCEQKKAQAEFIFWESLSRNLFTANH